MKAKSSQVIITESQEANVERKTWMILKGESEVSNVLAHALEQSLRSSGHQIVIVESGETYKRLGPKHFAINLDSGNRKTEEHFDHIIETLNKLDIHLGYWVPSKSGHLCLK